MTKLLKQVVNKVAKLPEASRNRLLNIFWNISRIFLMRHNGFRVLPNLLTYLISLPQRQNSRYMKTQLNLLKTSGGEIKDNACFSETICQPSPIPK